VTFFPDIGRKHEKAITAATRKLETLRGVLCDRGSSTDGVKYLQTKNDDAVQIKVQQSVKITPVSRHVQKGFIKLFISINHLIVLICKLRKGKAIPLQARTGPEDSRTLRLPYFKTVGTLRW